VETSIPNIVRSQFEDGQTIKVRRRTTGIIRKGEATITLPSTVYDDFMYWFEVAMQGGVIPSRFKFPPDGREQVWRVSAPPQISWIDSGGKAFRVELQIEQLPDWRTL
jgi:hypothetical protein